MSGFFHSLGAKIFALVSGVLLLFSGSHTAITPPTTQLAAVATTQTQDGNVATSSSSSNTLPSTQKTVATTQVTTTSSSKSVSAPKVSVPPINPDIENLKADLASLKTQIYGTGGGTGGGLLNAFAQSQLGSKSTINNVTITNSSINGTSDFSVPTQSKLGSSFAVASGQSISAGDFVSILADGTVGRSGAATGLIFGNPIVATSSASIPVISTLDSTHFALAYRDSTNSNKLSVQVASVSGTAITFGTGVLATSSTNTPVISTLDSTHLAMIYNDTTNSSKTTTQVCSVSGSTVTCGVGTVATSSTSNTSVITTLDSTHFAFAYDDSANSSKISTQVCSVSGIAVTCGTGLVATSSIASVRISTIDSTHYVLVYGDTTNSTKLTSQVCSVSGTTVTCATGIVISNTNADFGYNISQLSPTGFALTYRDSSNGNKATNQACSISGTTISCGSGVASSNANLPVIITLDSTHFAIAYTDSANSSRTTTQACSVSGTTVTCGAAYFVSNNTNTGSIISTLDATHFAIVYRDSTNSNKTTSHICSVSDIVVTCSTGVTVSNNNVSTPVISTLDSTHFTLVYPNNDIGTFTTSIIGAYSSTAATSTGLGIANASANAGDNVSVIFQGIAGGFSNLIIGTTYYANGDGTITATSTPNPLGVAISSSQILLNNSSNVRTLTQFFGDAVFLNNFRITEGWDNPQSLIFKNQHDAEVARIDENGDLTISGKLHSAGGEGTNNATTTVSSLLADVFASVSGGLHNTLASIGDSVVRTLGDAVYATKGIFDSVFAHSINADDGNFNHQLCVSKSDGTPVCVTGDQLSNVLNSAGVEPATSTPASMPLSSHSATSSDESNDDSATSTDPFSNTILDLITPPAETSTSTADTIDATSSGQL